MYFQHFIFSNDIRYRVPRHVTFWIAWWLYFIVTFLLPTFHFPGWAEFKSPLIEKFGWLFFAKRIMIISSLIPVILPQALYTYIILYFLLPRLFLKPKNILIFSVVLAGMLTFTYIASIGLMYLPFYHSYIIGMRNDLPSIIEMIHFVNKSYLFHLPIVIGFGVMIKLAKRWWIKQKEIEQMEREKARAELQLLKAQIHPHFLFNTLNNIYFFTLNVSPQAPEMIKKLTRLLYYILNECNAASVPLEKELKMVQDYIALEKIRYGEQIDLKTEISETGGNNMIAPLLLIPFVENSFKHGASKMITRPWIKLRITIEDGVLHFFIINSKPLTRESRTGNGNIGLKNVKKRLQLLYPGAYELNIIAEPESFTVFLNIHLKEIIASAADTAEIKQLQEYVLA